MPTKDFRAKVYNNKIIHENNPVLNWAMGNAVIRKDHNENIMLDKSRAIQRIDPAASLMNSHVRVWLNAKPEKVCPYNKDRGILML
jgi:phage terminase large subunit-like protein